MNEKGKRSNHLNRIVCILTEDISISEAHLIPYVNTILSKYRNEAASPDQEDFREIIEMLYQLCKAKKGRIGSHV